MNRIYRIVFNRTLGVPQVVSEHAGSRGGSGAARGTGVQPGALRTLHAAMLLVLAGSGLGLPVMEAQAGTGGAGGEGNRAFRCLYGSGGAAGTSASPNGGDGGSMNLNGEDCSRGSPDSGGGGGGASVSRVSGTGGTGGKGGLGTDGVTPTAGGVGGSVGQVMNSGFISGGFLDGGNGGGGQNESDMGGRSGGGGGGGGGGFAMAYTGSAAATSGGILTGGKGGNGGSALTGSALNGGGGGGEGGGGLLMTGNASVTNTSSIQGGSGGNGGNSFGASYGNGGDGGGGGSGGSGVVATGGGSVVNQQGASIAGAAGGNGGNGGVDPTQGDGKGGNGGSGGFGIELSNGQVVNNGTLQGGNGGTAGTGGRGNGVAGVGGAGLSGSDLQVINSGSIAGGLADGGGNRADAITFTGGTNLLELRAGSSITGRVNATAGSADTLRLGGDADSSFDVGSVGVQYQGFEAFEKTGLSTWTLTGSGPTTPWIVRDGLLSISDSVTLGGATLTLANGGLRTTADMGVIAPIQLSGSGSSIQTQAGTTTTLHGTLSGSGALVKTGTGTLVLSGINTYAGGTNLQSGVLSTGSDANLGSGPMLLNGGTWRILGDGYTTTTRLISLLANSTIDVASAGNTLTLGQSVGGAGGLTKAGAGRLVLTGNNSYSGLTTVAAGTLEGNASSLRGNISNQATVVFDQGTAGTYGGSITGNGALVKNGTGTLTMGGVSAYFGGTLINAGTLQVSASSILGQITNNANLLFAQTADGTYAGRITGTGHVTKTGNGTLTLTANSGHTGGTTVTAGTLRGTSSSLGGDIQSAGVVNFNQEFSGAYDGVLSGTGSLLKSGLGWLTLTGNNTYTGGTTIGSGTLEGTTNSLQGDIVNFGQVVFNQATLGTYAGVISGPGSLEKRGTGLLRLTDPQTYTGRTTVSAGALELAGNTLAGNLLNNASVVFNQTASNTYAGQISGAGSVLKLGTGALTLSGTNTYTGGTLVQLGSLTGNTASLQGAITNNALLVFNQATDGIYAGALVGTGQIQKAGAGSLIVNGNGRSFAGHTEVARGRLVVGGTGAQSSAVLGGDVAVVAGAAIGGHGTVAGNVSVAASGTLSPGNSIGTLSVEGNLTLDQGSVLDFEFGAPAPGNAYAASGQGDSVMVGQDLALNGAILNVSNAGGFGAGLYRLFTYGGALTVTNGGIVPGNNAANGLALQYLTGDKQINLLNLSGSTLQFWNADGQASPTRAGGGSGIWSNTSPVWTDADGTLTSVMNPLAGFAIFAGQAGTVVVDQTDGAVQSSGLQFASSGYRLLGDGLTLVQDGNGDQPIVRVGDGSAQGATFVATIENDIAGTSGLVKTDLGTLVLQGNNTYTGTTRIEGGAIEVAQDAALGAASTDLWLDGGVLRVAGNQLGSVQRTVHLGGNGGGIDVVDGTHTFALNQALTGSGSFTKLGAGTLLLTGANDYSGGSHVAGGTLLGSAESIQGNILNNARVVFDQTGTGRYAGDMTGTGSLTKTGNGVLQLAGTNTYSGGTVVEAGTLEGDAGSLQGDIVNDGSLVFVQGAAGTYAGTVSGSGSLVKAGAGDLRLSGVATHTGGTVVRDGALIGDTRTLQGQIDNDAQLVFDQGTDGDFNGAIAGSGALLKVGSGALTLVGAQRYSGGTRVEAGTVRGDTQSLQGDILNNARVVFQQASTGTFGGDISGAGALIKDGSGTLVLEGANTYAGGTVVASGTLQGTTDSIQGDIVNNATLVLDQAQAGILSGALSGSGELVKTGAGALTIRLGQAFAGTTDVQTGTLIVGDAAHPNAVLGGTVTVREGAAVQGVGTLGNLDLYGTLAPGNSIGTLHVAGDATLRASSRLLMEVDANGNRDQLAVGGRATIQGGTVLSLADGVNWAPVTDYAIMTAAGGITGQFDSVQSNLAFLNPTLVYGGNAITLSMMRNDISFASVGDTANQRSTAAGLDTVGVGTTYNRIVSLDRASAREAFDSLSGEIHASAQTVAVEDAARVRRAVMQRWAPADAAPEARNGVWASTWGAWGETDGDGNAARTTHHGTGLLVGADIDLDGAGTVGVAVGQSRSSVRVAARHADAQLEAHYAALYAVKPLGRWSLRGGVVAGRSDADVNRNTGSLLGNERLTSTDDAKSWQGFAELAYRAGLARAVIEPYLNVSALRFDQDRYAEEGGDAALVGEGGDARLGAARIGLRSQWNTASRFGTAFFVNLAYQHAWGDTTPTATHRFAAGGSLFEVSGISTVRNSGVGEVGFKSHLTEHVEIRGNYEGRFGSGFEDQGVRLTLTALF